MLVAFPIDGLICNTDELKAQWYARQGDWKFLNDAAFWAALKPYEDSLSFVEYIIKEGWDFYVFAERPKAVSLATRTWMRNHCGLILDKDRLVMQAIKRYDCRLLGVDTFIDSNSDDLENLKIETVAPIRGYLVDRERGDTPLQVAREINESIRSRCVCSTSCSSREHQKEEGRSPD